MQPGNILKIESLDEGWRDKDSVMLHACFQLLKDCVEQESLLDCHINWDDDEQHRWAKQEIETLYDWWLLYSPPTIPTQESYELENRMLTRLIAIRWSLWT
jgi:hypothetical protein